MRKICLLSLATVIFFGCSHVKGNFRNVEGGAFDLAKMEQVKTGLTLEEVTALVGPPYSTTEEGDTVVQRYYMVREKIDKDKAIGVFSLEKKTTETYNVTLTYENGILVNKHYLREVDKPKEKDKEEQQEEE